MQYKHCPEDVANVAKVERVKTDVLNIKKRNSVARNLYMIYCDLM